MKRSFTLIDRENDMGFDRFTVRIDLDSCITDNPPTLTTNDPLRLVESLINFLWEEKDESDAD